MIAKLALLCCLFWPQGHAAESPAFKFSRPVEYRDDGKQQLLAVALDGAIYQNSAGDFRDLRLIDQHGVETPYLLQKIAARKTVVQRLPIPSEAPALQKTGDDSIVISIALMKDAANADGFSIVTEQRNFEYDLQIQASNDGKDWQVLVNNAAIYDYSRYMPFGNRDISLPSNQFRHFKILVGKASQTRAAEVLRLTRTLQGSGERQRSETVDVSNEPLHIERIAFWHNQVETLPETEQSFDYPVTRFSVSQDAEHKTSSIDVETQRQPLTGLTIKSAAGHFSRPAEVQIPRQQGIETRMQTIGTATLEALHFQDIHHERTGISFPEQRLPHYRIVLANQDNPPLEIDNVIGNGPAYQLLFLPQSGLSYQLRYGSDQAESPRYDIATIRELLRRGYQYTVAGLGPEASLTTIDDGFDFAKLLNSKLFLGLAIGLMVLALGWSLYKVSKTL